MSRHLRVRRRLAATAAAVTLLAAACGSADEAADVSAAGAGDDAATSEPVVNDGPRLDPTILAGEAMTISGDTFDLGTLVDKDLVIWFWAPW